MGEKIRVAPRFVKFEIDRAACSRLDEMISFFKSFHFPKGSTLPALSRRSPNRILYFTNIIDPYESYHNRLNRGQGNVGGGCAPFAAALTKEAGVFQELFDNQWRTPLAVSTRLIGSADPDGRKIKVKDLAFGELGKSWIYEGYPSLQLYMYDPSKIWEFIGNVNLCVDGRFCDESVNDFIQELAVQRSEEKVLKEVLEVPVRTSTDDLNKKEYQLTRQTLQGLSVPLIKH